MNIKVAKDKKILVVAVNKVLHKIDISRFVNAELVTQLKRGAILFKIYGLVNLSNNYEKNQASMYLLLLVEGLSIRKKISWLGK